MGQPKPPPVTFVDEASLDAAVLLLLRFDPEHHHPKDYVLTIAGAIVGTRLCRRGE